MGFGVGILRAKVAIALVLLSYRNSVCLSVT